MADKKTISTEISVGLGLGGYQFTANDIVKIKNATNDDADDVIAWREASTANADICDKLWNVGLNIRNFNSKAGMLPTLIEWSGGALVTTGISAAKDLMEHYGPVTLSYSVKADSNIIYNSSPGRLEALTSGLPIHGGKYPNWYNLVAPVEYQRLYAACDGVLINGVPTIAAWDASRKSKEEKKRFGLHASSKIDTDIKAAAAYKALCDAVSTETAKRFTKNLNSVMATNPIALKTIFWDFFRLNSTAYVLCGLENKQGFAVKVLDRDTWNKQYKITAINAAPKPAGQPEVLLCFTFTDLNKAVYTFNLKLEIRWSHGKFCGNPEAKVYKQFSYKELPWNTSII